MTLSLAVPSTVLRTKVLFSPFFLLFSLVESLKKKEKKIFFFFSLFLLLSLLFLS